MASRGLLSELSDQAVFDRLVLFEHTSRWLPMAIVTTPNGEYSSVIIDYDGADADRMKRSRHVSISWEP
jgi:hypothetical protein